MLSFLSFFHYIIKEKKNEKKNETTLLTLLKANSLQR